MMVSIMDKAEYARQYYELLNMVEDYFKSGFHSHIYPDRSILTRQNTGDTSLSTLADQIRNCTKCDLHFNRRKPVPGYGVLNPQVMVIGEAPGGEEDKTGKPFVGRAGQYLDKWLKAIDIFRDKNCFIGNIIKCRPPNNRDPQPEEIAACLPYLEKQLEIIKPRTILCLGRISSRVLLSMEKGIGSLRGKEFSYKGIPLIPTYHPSAVLRNTNLRALVWEDLKMLRALFADENLS